MTMTLADRRTTPEASGLPEQLAFKTAEATEALTNQTVAVDETEGTVTAIVSVTGVVDEVDDVIVPGAYTETLSKRRPKVCWAHSWDHPIGKVLYIEELMPGDERLPTKTRDGKAWPKEAGALVAVMKFNLRTDEGKNAFEVVRFYSESGECEYSIGYNVPAGKASTGKGGTRFIKMLELYELSVVLFGAHTMTGTLSIKAAVAAARESKRLVRSRLVSKGIDFGAMQAKAPVPPQFRKDEDEKPTEGEVDKPAEAQDAEDAEKDPCTCCGGSGEHDCGHECYSCDAAGTLEAQAEGNSGVPDGQPIVCEGHHGRVEPDPEREHQPDAVSPTSAPPGTPVAGETTEPTEGAEEGAEEPEEGEGADTRPPGTEQVETTDPNAPAEPGDAVEKPETPDFSDGIMVAVYPDPAAADAIAAHIAGPDQTTPREELHVTLAYLGKIGGGAPTEQEVIDAVTRAVEGHPALEGEVGGIGQFPPGEDGTPTYAPVDVPGLGLLREQIVSELGEAVYNDHGFTPHMTLGYDIGLIDSVPPTPLRIDHVSVVYGSSRRDVTLGAPLAESKTHIITAGDDLPTEAKAGDRLLILSDDGHRLHVCESDDPIEWKAVDVVPDDEAKADLNAEQRHRKPTLPGSDDRFPIGNEEDLRAAVQSYGRAKDDEKDKVKRWIIKRARELGKVNLLPDDWNVSDDEKKAAAYDPTLDRLPGEPYILPTLSQALADAMEAKAGGSDRNRGQAEELRKYWTTGEGGVAIGWGTPGDFTRCVAMVSEHMTPERAKGYCANRHKEMTGVWPGDDKNTGDGKDANVDTETKDSPTPAPSGKSYPYMPGSFEERQQAIRHTIEAQYEDDVDEHGHRNVWVDVRSTWTDRVLYSVDRMSGSSECDHFLATYRFEDDVVELGEPQPVDLHIVPVLPEGAEAEEDYPVGDTLPLVESLMGMAIGVKDARRAMEGKAGRVLSGANERALRTAMEHLISVLTAAGIDLGDVTPENPAPMTNTGSGGDTRREMDPAVDLETTSPTASTKGAEVETEGKGHPQSGEVLTIDMEEHRRILAEIEAATS